MSLRNSLFLILAFLFCSLTSQAQNRLSGVLRDTANAPVAGGYVILRQGGSIVNSASSKKDGSFEIKDLPDGKYLLDITCIGFESISDSINLMGNVKHDYVLKEGSTELDEVVVSADKSQVVTRTATGQRFYLSAEAKKLHNPFEALQEIPLLISNPNNSTVTMLNGDSPLILIDGKLVNSGISPISPADIESVEVVNSVSARFLQQGVTHIVNIRLKRGAHPYVWLQAATRHDIPIDKGFGVGYFEVGNKAVSLYGRASYTYTHNDDVEMSVNRENTTYKQNYEQTSRTNGDMFLSDLMLKYQPTKNDYFAAYAYYTDDHKRQKQNALGTYITDATQQYRFNAYNKNVSKIFTSILYYLHTFAKNNMLETRLAYNFNKNDLNQDRTDYYDDEEALYSTPYKNQRHSGSLQIDYSQRFKKGSSLAIGSHSTLLRDKIDFALGENPLFRHRKFNQYLYAGYGGKFKSLYFNGSVGVEGIWAKAGDASYNYIRPRVSASLTWTVNDNNSAQLGYTLTNSEPSVAMLNPYNTSTDPLYVAVGNPDLKPQLHNQVRLNYTFNYKGLYLTPLVSYTRVSDMIEDYGYTKDGIYYSTYANSGHFSRVSTGLDASYRLRIGRANGRVYAGAGWNRQKYSGQDSHNYWNTFFGGNLRAGRFYFGIDASYNPRDYSKVSVTKYHQLDMANVQVNYNFTPDFYIGVCLQYATGEFRGKTYTTDGSYRSVVDTRYKDRSFRPWVLIRYTFRKNSKNKHRLNNVLKSEEQGISVVR